MAKNENLTLLLCEEYENKKKTKSKKKRNKRKQFAKYMDQQLQGKVFNTKEEAETFILQKRNEYISGLGFIEAFLLKIFLNWIINKLIDAFTKK